MQNHDTTDLSELLECVTTLASDADESEREMFEAETDLAKRHFVRAIFAWIEALSYLFRRAAFLRLVEKPLTLETIPTLLALQEKTYTLNEKGLVSPALLKVPTSAMMLFSLKSFAQSQGLPLNVDKGGSNWQAYARALAIRDRLTHPKKPSDVRLSEADIEAVREAKGMVLSYLKLVLNPSIIAVIKAHSEIAKSEGRGITLTFTEDDLKNFKD